MAAKMIVALVASTVVLTVGLLPHRAAALEAVGPPANDAAPVAYRIDLTIDPAQTTYTGHVEIDATTQETQVLHLNGRDLRVARVTVRLAGETVVGSYQQMDPEGHAQITFARALPAGRITIVVDYSADIHEGPPALFHAKVDQNWYVGSVLMPTNARRVFPCFDQLNLKTPFTITLTVPKGVMAVSNMPEESRTSVGPNERHAFKQSPPLPTYLATFAVGRFAVETGVIPPTPQRPYPLPLRVLAPLGQEAKLGYTLQQSSDFVQRLEKLFDLPFPYPKLDQIASPVTKGGTENAGAVLYGQDQVLPGEHASPRDYASFGFLVAHELAHQWFGDSVTPRWWDDIWLKESFASWAATVVANEWNPNVGVIPFARAQTFLDMDGDSLPGSKSMHQPIGEANANSGYTGAYGKGSQMLGMFEQYIGAARFRAGVHDYLAAHANSSATANDFFVALAKAAGEPAIVSAMQTFTNQPGVPTLDLQRTGRTLEIHQHRYAALGVDVTKQTWAIPFCFKQNGAKHCSLVHQENIKITLDQDAPIVPNADGAGYYRYNLSSQRWAQLTADSGKLTVGEALALNDSLWSAFVAGKVGFARLLDAMRELATNDEPDVALYVAKHLMELRARGIVPDRAESPYQQALAAAYTPVLAKLGFEVQAGRYLGEDRKLTRLRSDVVRVLALGAADRATCQVLEEGARRFLAGDLKSLDPAFRYAAFVTYLRLGGRAAGEALLKSTVASSDGGVREVMLRALGSSDRSDIGEWLVSALGNTGLRTAEEMDLVPGLLSNSHTTGPALAWLRSHYAPLTALGLGQAWGPGIAEGVCSRSDETVVESVIRPQAPAGTSAAFQLDRTLEAIHACATLREAKADEIARTLKVSG
jgi:aminopeptidase N